MPSVPQDLFGDFVRGCLDGDGTVVVWQDPRWRHPWQMSTRFISGSIGFLRDMQKRLHEEFGLTKGGIQRLRRAFVLRYSIADSVKLYNLLYKDTRRTSLLLKRKRNKFESFKKVRPDCFKTVAPSSSLA